MKIDREALIESLITRDAIENVDVMLALLDAAATIAKMTGVQMPEFVEAAADSHAELNGLQVVDFDLAEEHRPGGKVQIDTVVVTEEVWKVN